LGHTLLVFPSCRPRLWSVPLTVYSSFVALRFRIRIHLLPTFLLRVRLFLSLLVFLRFPFRSQSSRGVKHVRRSRSYLYSIFPYSLSFVTRSAHRPYSLSTHAQKGRGTPDHASFHLHTLS